MRIATAGLLIYVYGVLFGFIENREIPLEFIGTIALLILFGICLELAKLNKKKG